MLKKILVIQLILIGAYLIWMYYYFNVVMFNQNYKKEVIEDVNLLLRSQGVQFKIREQGAGK